MSWSCFKVRSLRFYTWRNRSFLHFYSGCRAEVDGIIRFNCIFVNSGANANAFGNFFARSPEQYAALLYMIYIYALHWWFVFQVTCTFIISNWAGIWPGSSSSCYFFTVLLCFGYPFIHDCFHNGWALLRPFLKFVLLVVHDITF